MTLPTCQTCGHGLLLFWRELQPGVWVQTWRCDPCAERAADAAREAAEASPSIAFSGKRPVGRARP